MSERTPTTEDVRHGYAWLSAGDNPGAREAAEGDFDTWLAAHDAQVRAEIAEQIAQAIEAIDERSVLDRKDALLMCARIASEHSGAQ
ncbi:hypothetical protein [Pseudactinotalea sp. Z1732]|uniref:hypothetical protein n=1 Tax=Micrococcales TaxID=85006 RepID=UPI003C7CA852